MTTFRAAQEVTEERLRVRILDLYLDRIGMADVMQRVQGFVRSATPHQIVTVNLQFLSIAARDPAFARIVNGADLAVTDGMPLIWLSKLVGAPIAERITGHDILRGLSILAAEEGYSVYLLGGEPGVAEESHGLLCKMYPGLKVAGTQHGYFTAEEEPDVMRSIKSARPDILLVALGCPKQEYWIHQSMHDLGVPVCVGVGSTFDFLTGRLKRSPVWMQRAGLEWLYRLQSEPRRLWKRYVLEGMPTALRAISFAIRVAVYGKVRER